MSAYQELVRGLASRRREQSIRQREIASALRMPQSGIARLEICKYEPRLSTVLSYAEVLGQRVEFGDNDFLQSFQQHALLRYAGFWMMLPLTEQRLSGKSQNLYVTGIIFHWKKSVQRWPRSLLQQGRHVLMRCLRE